MQQVIDKRYKILGKLGSGAMGEVYKVKDLSYNKIIALKTISKKMASSEAVVRFKREFRLLAELHHPNLCAVYDFGTLKDGRNYFTMEYIEGQNIFEFTRKLPYEEIYPVSKDISNGVYPLIVQLCRVLEYIHSKGLIHHDIKPGNVFVQMFDGKPVVKLMDFGLAGEHRIRGGALVRGTFPYIAPEVVKGLAIDHRADLFSLGIVLYEIFTQIEVPIKDKESFVTLLKQQEDVVSELPSNIVADIPKGIERLILRLLAFEPAGRYSRANEVIIEINKLGSLKFELETEKTLEGYLLSSKFVGREKEMALLQSLYEETKQGKGQVVFITGEAGIGKSRLLKEFKIYTQLRRGYSFTGYTHKEKTTSLEPFHDIFCELINYIKDNHDHFRSRKLKLSLALLFKIFSDLGNGHLKRGLPSIVPLGPQQERLRNFEAISELLGYSASRLGELVILLEDLHWADDVTIQCLEYLGRNLRGRNILICGTCRSEELEDNQTFNKMMITLKKEGYFNRLELKPLNFKNLYSFMDSTITAQSNSSDLVKYLMSKTGGNPYFVEEIMRTLVHKKGVSIGEKIEIEYLQKISIPETIEGVVLRRLRDLDVNSEKVVKYGAVLLKDFSYELMKRLTGLANIDLSMVLWELKKRQILIEENNTYRFYHATLCEALNKRMAYREKRKLYYQIGKSLEFIYKKNTEKAVEDLAYYFINAKDRKKGIKYGLQAAKKSSDRYANEQAFYFYRSILHLLGDKNLKLRFDILRKIANIVSCYGNPNDAIKYCNKAVSMKIGTTNQKILIYGVLGYTYKISGKLKMALRIYQKAKRLLKTMAPSKLKFILETYIDSTICIVYLSKGDFRSASEFHFDILKLSKALLKRGKQAIKMQTIIYLNIALIEDFKAAYGRGDYNKAISYYMMVYERFKKMISKQDIGKTLNNLGICYMNKFDLPHALNCYKKAIEIAEKIGDQHGMSSRLDNLGNFYITKGNYSKALGSYQRALFISKKFGDHSMIVNSLMGIGLCLFNLCNYKKSKVYLEETKILCDDLGLKEHKIISLKAIGCIHQMLGDYMLALKLYRQTLRLSKNIKHTCETSISFANLGSLFVEIGELLKARRYIKEALKTATAMELKDTETKCYIYLCLMNIITKEYITAFDYYKKGIKIAKNIGLRREMLRLNILNSDLHYYRENYAKGSSIADRAIKLARDMGTKELLVEALLMKVKNGVKQGILSKIEVIKFLDEAKAVAEKIGCPEVLWRVYFEYGRFLEGCKEYMEALGLYQKCVDVFKEVVNKIKKESYKRSYLNRPDRQIAMRQPSLLMSKIKDILQKN